MTSHNHNIALDQSWIDTKGAGNSNKFSGCLPRTDKPGQYFGFFEENFKGEILDVDEIRAAIKKSHPNTSSYSSYKYHQGNNTMCTANAACQGHNYLQCKQYGSKFVFHLAPPSLYDFCGRPGSGSNVGDIVRRLRDHGGVPVDTDRNKALMEKAGLDPTHVLDERAYRQGTERKWDKLKETAQHFQLDECFEIQGTNGFFTALVKGFCVHYGRSGHSILAADAILKIEDIIAKYQDSYGDSGDNGFRYDTYNYIKRSSAPYGAYAYRSIHHSPPFDRLLKLDLEQRMAL